MSHAPDTHILLRAFADELARLRIAGVCTSPGSRSSPILLALVGQPGLETWSHIDERAAGFFAVGVARATGGVPAVTCTSGTAAAEYLPAIIEAHEAGLPLLVITADRPPELRNVGAGQAIDQTKLYGTAVRWFVDIGHHDATAASERWIRTLAARCVAVATGALGERPGPVHINWPLREPLVPPADLAEGTGGRAGGVPWLDVIDQGRHDGPTVGALLGDAERGVLVAGDGGDVAFGPAVVALADALGWPLLADPMSGARHGKTAVESYDALLRSEHWAEGMRPDVVLRVGQLPTSKALRQWLARATDVRQLAISGPGQWPDPDGVLDTVLASNRPITLVNALAQAIKAQAQQPESKTKWRERWTAADADAQTAIDVALGDELSEPAVARMLLRETPVDTLVVVASSMPVRDLETFGRVAGGSAGCRVISNRGANGIDGTLATCAGAAHTHAGPTVVVLGDVAFHYDVSALLSAQRLDIGITIVVTNNGGGGIFDFLPLAEIDGSTYRDHITTAPPARIEAAAAMYGASYQAVESVQALEAALRATKRSERRVLEIRTDRARNVTLHRTVWSAVQHSLEQSAPSAPSTSRTERA